jgi:hypothetical protein
MHISGSALLIFAGGAAAFSAPAPAVLRAAHGLPRRGCGAAVGRPLPAKALRSFDRPMRLHMQAQDNDVRDVLARAADMAVASSSQANGNGRISPLAAPHLRERCAGQTSRMAVLTVLHASIGCCSGRSAACRVSLEAAGTETESGAGPHKRSRTRPGTRCRGLQQVPGV